MQNLDAGGKPSTLVSARTTCRYGLLLKRLVCTCVMQTTVPNTNDNARIHTLNYTIKQICTNASAYTKKKVGDGDKRLKYKLQPNYPDSKMRCGRFYPWMVRNANSSLRWITPNSSDKKGCHEHTNARPWCHGNLLYEKLPRHIATNKTCAVLSQHKMSNTNINATPHPTTELKIRNLKCCWVAVCMKRHKCPLAQVIKTRALRCINKTYNTKGIAATPTYPRTSPSDD